jgi:hypothetical protein
MVVHVNYLELGFGPGPIGAYVAFEVVFESNLKLNVILVYTSTFKKKKKVYYFNVVMF